jgi:molecular chaperone DnaJ
MSKDYYNILGVAKSASKEEIKRAFREKAHLYHPDKPGGDENKFKEVNEAYQVLGNDEKRRQYDQYGSTFDQQGGFGQGMNWDDFMRQARQGGGSYSNVNFDIGDLGDIFSDLFGGSFGFGGSRKQRTTRGRDLEVDLNLTFREAVFGVEKMIEITKLTTCSHCQGNGAEPGTKITNCKTCLGSGQVRKTKRTILGNIQTVDTCPECHGEGKTYAQACTVCQGQGRVREKKDLKVKIPAGIDNGVSVKMAGEGEAGIKGGKSGDLYLHIHVSKDPNFIRQGDDILSLEKIDFSVAALGGKVVVKTIDGEVTLKIPAGTESGQVFRLKGKGVPHWQHYGKGDQLVEIFIKTPKNLNKKQKQLLADLQQEGL